MKTNKESLNNLFKGLGVEMKIPDSKIRCNKKTKEELKLFNIALIGDSIKDSNKQYFAENEEECKRLFLQNNLDLDDSDIWVEEVKKMEKK